MAAEKAKKKRNGSRRASHTETIGSIFNELCDGEVQQLKDELEEWRDNLEANEMTHLPKFEELEDALSYFEEWDQLKDEFPDFEWPAGWLDQEVKFTIDTRKAKRNTRHTRLSNVLNGVHAVYDWIEGQTAEDELSTDQLNTIGTQLDTLRAMMDALESVSFPRMF